MIPRPSRHDRLRGMVALRWFHDVREALGHYEAIAANSVGKTEAIRRQIRGLTHDAIMGDARGARRGHAPDEIADHFRQQLLGRTREEIVDHFGRQRRELDFQASLLFLTTAEGVLQTDWRRRRDVLGRKLWKAARRRPKRRLNLEDDVLDAWAQERTECRGVIGHFKGALRFRHWLAHGRYWTPKLGERYDARRVFHLTTVMFQKMGDVTGWT